MRKTTQLFKALADQNRLRILLMLCEKELCVCEITEVIQLAPSTVSKHLSILRNTDLIVDRKCGRWINYSLNPRIHNQLIDFLQNELKSDSIYLSDITKIKTVDRHLLCNP